MSTAVSNNKFVGSALNADQLGSVAASSYARTDTGTTFSSTVNIASASGLTIGSSNNFTIGHAGSLTRLVNNVNNANIAVIANVSGTPFTAITVDGTTGSTIIANLSTSGAFETTGYIRTTQGDNATSTTTGAIRVVGGIGLSGNIFTSNAVNAANVVVTSNVTTGNLFASRQIRVTNGVDATSTSTGDIVVSGGIGLGGNVWTAGNLIANQGLVTTIITTGSSATQGNITGNWLLTGGSRLRATYADLAERFEADQSYDAGTVVQWGGEREITAVRDELSIDVCGVISHSAAYIMNDITDDDSTHPAIALSGRVPVKVVGKVKKHDRLVSAGNGLARVAKPEETNPFTVIGRALQSKESDDIGQVIALVTINR